MLGVVVQTGTPALRSLGRFSFKKRMWSVSVLVLLLWTDTMSKATLIKTTFNWGWLTGSVYYYQGRKEHGSI